jgi:hypothetical protein
LAKKLHQEFTGLYSQHLQDNDVELQMWNSRIYFVNENGIRYGARGGEMNEV